MTEGVRRVFRLVALAVGIAVMGEGAALGATKTLDAAAVKQKVVERGVGKEMKVGLGDGRTVSGEIVWIGEEGFQLKSKHEPQPTDVTFEQVTRVGGSGWWMFWRR